MPRSSPTASTTRPTASASSRASHAPSCPRGRARECRQVTDGDWHAGDPAWSPDGEQLAFAAATRPTGTWCFSAPVHVVAARRASDPEPVALADWSPSPSPGPPTAPRCSSSAETAGPAGHARLLRIPLGGGEVVDLAASLDRNVMPGGPATREACRSSPTTGDVALLRPRPGLHPPLLGPARRR